MTPESISVQGGRRGTTCLSCMWRWEGGIRRFKARGAFWNTKRPGNEAKDIQRPENEAKDIERHEIEVWIHIRHRYELSSEMHTSRLPNL